MAKIWCGCRGMRSSLSSKKSVLAREDASGDSGSELEEFWWRIVLMGFQGLLGFAHDSVTRGKKGFGFGNEGSDWVAFGSEFREVKGKLPASPTSLTSTTLFLGSANYGINSWTIISDLIGAWMWINVNWYFLIKCIANTLHWLCSINLKVGIFIIGVNDHDLDLEHRLDITMLTSV